MMNIPLLTIRIADERDVVAARQRARQLAELLGFERRDQIAIATALSEIARNAWDYAGGGSVSFQLSDTTSGEQQLSIVVSDKGKGIADLDAILYGVYRSPHGMGLGITGARRLMDAFKIDTSPSGTVISMAKSLPPNAHHMNGARVSALLDRLAIDVPADQMNELRDREVELVRTMEELREKQQELLRLNRELEDTNRGVVALYAELDEKAERLRQADELKSKFLSNMSHEFRTPLNSILALSHLLLSNADGELSEEQQKQISFIRRAANDLTELVNDLLDLAKVEAGKSEVHVTRFEVDELFGALRGMMRPLMTNEGVTLVFDDAHELPPLESDEGKIAQILRNFISNALKFTEQGEVRVSARLAPDRSSILFSVSDTGIGIPPESQEVIFHEFAQLDNPMQRRVKGTGLGLPLSRKLAELLGGSVSVDSRPATGSTFFATIPIVYAERGDAASAATTSAVPSRAHERIERLLVIDDEEVPRYLVRQLLESPQLAIVEAEDGESGIEQAFSARPNAIVLDVNMPKLNGIDVLGRLRDDERTRDLPVLVVTSMTLEESDRRRIEELSAELLSKESLTRDALFAGLARAMAAITQSNRSNG